MAENEGVAAPAATTEAPAVTTPEAPTKPTGTNAGEVKQSARGIAKAAGEKYEAARQAAREKHHSQNQPRDEVGKFVEGEAAPAAEPTQVLSGSATAEATASTEAANQPPAGMVRIELPEGHPLRDQATTYLDVPAGQERTFRAAVNAAARRSEVEAAERRFQEAEAARIRTEAALRFYQENGNSLWTPADQELYDDILASYAALGPEKAKQMADAYKRGREAEARTQLGQVTEQADLEALSTAQQADGGTFRNDAFALLPNKYPGVQRAEIDQALRMYAFEVDAKRQQAWQSVQGRMSPAEFERRWAQEFRLSEADFFAVAGGYLESRPGVIAQSQAARQAAELRERQIRAEAEAAERERLKGAAQRHATNPQRALGGVSTGQRTTDTTPQAPDRTKMNPTEIRRAGREAARAAGDAFERGYRR